MEEYKMYLSPRNRENCPPDYSLTKNTNETKYISPERIKLPKTPTNLSKLQGSPSKNKNQNPNNHL